MPPPTRPEETLAARLPRLLRAVPPAAVLALTAALLAELGMYERWLGLERPAAIALGIVGVAAVLWVTEAVPLFVTSLIVLSLELTWLAPALRAAGDSPSGALFLAPFFTDVTLLFLGGFVLSAGLERTGVDRRLALTLLRPTGGRPTAVLVALIVATAFLSMWMSNTAACALALGLAQPLLAPVPPGDALRRAVPVGVALAANVGGLGTPIGSPPNAIAMASLASIGARLSFGGWMLAALPMVIVLLVVLALLLPRLFPTEVKELALPAEPDAPRSTAARLTMVVTALTIAGWLIGERFGITPGTVALLPVVVLFGAGVLGVRELRALPWDVILLIGGGLSLGAAVEQAGLAERVASWIAPAPGQAALFGATIALIGAAVSAFMSNTAAANLIVPVVVGFAAIERAPLLLAAALACSVSMPLPVSTPPNAMAFATGTVSVRDLVVPGLVLTLLGVALVALGPYWWRVLALE